MTKEFKIIIESILERERYGQLCPQTIEELEKMLKIGK